MYRQTRFPRYRGINLDGMFCTAKSTLVNPVYGTRRGVFEEKDFQEVADFGFDFVRLPLSYRLFTVPEKPYELDPRKLEMLDQAVAWGEKHHLHVNINFHRVPGYCVNEDEEGDPFPLCQSPEGVHYFCAMWRVLAERYRGISSEKITFDLVNEPSPKRHTLEEYISLMRKCVAAVHEIDPGRLCMIDGWQWGDVPIQELADLPMTGQSCRSYDPRGLTHYGLREDTMCVPSWPMRDFYGVWWDRTVLAEHFDSWARLAEQHSIPVHCGEFACHRNAPRHVLLAWLEDVLSILKERNIGWAWWTCRGPNGLYRDPEHLNVFDPDIVRLLQKY